MFPVDVCDPSHLRCGRSPRRGLGPSVSRAELSDSLPVLYLPQNAASPHAATYLLAEYRRIGVPDPRTPFTADNGLTATLRAVGDPPEEKHLPETVTEDSLRRQNLSPKKVHLIRTTYRAISEKGAHRVSLQEIADRAEVSKGIILYHFATKDRLMLETMEWVLQRNAERIRKAIATETTPRRQVLVMLEVIFRDAEANRRFYLTYLDLLDHAARVVEFGKLNATFHSIVNSLYADVIRNGVSAGVFEVEDVDEAAYTLRAIVDGLFLQWVQETDWRRLHPKYREICKRAVLTYLRTAPAESV